MGQLRLLGAVAGGTGAVVAEATIFAIPAAVPTTLGGSLIAAVVGAGAGVALVALAPFRGMVRRSEADADDDDEAVVFARPFSDAAPRLQAHSEERYGVGSWEDRLPAYLFGWDRANRPDLDEMPWDDAQPGLRKEWARRHPEEPWSAAEEAVLAGWEKARALAPARAARRI